MPQLVPFAFLNQLSYGFLALLFLVFIISKYLLPLLLQLQLARKVLNLFPPHKAFEQMPWVFYRSFHLFDLFCKFVYKFILRTGGLITFFLDGFNDVFSCYLHRFRGFYLSHHFRGFYLIYYYVLKGILWFTLGLHKIFYRLFLYNWVDRLARSHPEIHADLTHGRERQAGRAILALIHPNVDGYAFEEIYHIWVSYNHDFIYNGFNGYNLFIPSFIIKGLTTNNIGGHFIGFSHINPWCFIENTHSTGFTIVNTTSPVEEIDGILDSFYPILVNAITSDLTTILTFNYSRFFSITLYNDIVHCYNTGLVPSIESYLNTLVDYINNLFKIEPILYLPAPVPQISSTYIQSSSGVWPSGHRDFHSTNSSFRARGKGAVTLAAKPSKEAKAGLEYRTETLSLLERDDSLYTAPQLSSTEALKALGFFNNSNLDPLANDLINYLFEVVLPKRPTKAHPELLLSWYNDIRQSLNTMSSGYVDSPIANNSVTHTIKIGTTDKNGVSIIGILWDKLGFSDNLTSPYMDKFEGSEGYDGYVRTQRTKLTKEIDDIKFQINAGKKSTRLNTLLTSKEKDLKNVGLFLTHSNGRLLTKWIYNFIVLSLLAMIRFDLSNLDPDSDAYINLLPLSDELRRGLIPYIRKALAPTTLRLQSRVYAGFDTEYVTQEMGSVNLISYQLSLFTRVLLDAENVEGLNLNKGMQAIGDDFNITYDNNFAHSSNVAVLAQSLYVLTDFMRVNKVKNTISVLEHLSLKNLLHKSVNSKGTVQYCILKETPKDFPINHIKYIKEGESLTLKDVVSKCRELGISSLHNDWHELNNMVYDASNPLEEQLKPEFPGYSDLLEMPVNIVRQKKIPVINEKNLKLFLIGHYVVADLSVLSDFNRYKTELDLIKKSFTTLTKPINILHGDGKHTYVYVRDTMMLCPPGTSLQTLGKEHGLPKIDLPEGAISRMDLLQKDHPALFDKYALRDAEIALMHALSYEHFNATESNGIVMVPTTIASLAKNYAIYYREKHHLPDIQRFGEYHIGHFNKLFTPHGIQATGNLAAVVPLFLGSYRGGRNESFAYGFDLKDTWSDLDLTSAYTTAAALAGDPAYEQAFIIPGTADPKTIEEFLNGELLYNSFSTFQVDFKFPKGTKYPCLPVHLDKTLTIYPLEGTTYVNGFSLKVAIDHGCKITGIKFGAIVPFNTPVWISYDSDLKRCVVREPQPEEIERGVTTKDLLNTLPYFGHFADVQRNRRRFPKGSLYNSIWKLIGNSGYGNMAIGLSAKAIFNSRSNRMDRTNPSELTNPIIASFVTDFVRAALSEAMFNADEKGGQIISCTTDGFITNLKGLHDDPSMRESPLLAFFSLGRELLSGDPRPLEEKTGTKGIATWAVRGQLGLGEDTTLKAMTGFQSKYRTMKELQNMVMSALDQGNKEITFMQQSLRGGKDIYEKGGHVTPKMEEKAFRLVFDNRRKIVPFGSSPVILQPESKSKSKALTSSSSSSLTSPSSSSSSSLELETLKASVVNARENMKGAPEGESRELAITAYYRATDVYTNALVKSFKYPASVLTASENLKAAPDGESRELAIIAYDRATDVYTNALVKSVKSKKASKKPSKQLPTLLFTIPWETADFCKTSIMLSKLGKHQYAENSGYPILGSRFKSYRDIAITMFQRALLQGYMSSENPFKSYRDLSDWMLVELGVKVPLYTLGNNARSSSRKFIPHSIPRCLPPEAFLDLALRKLEEQHKITFDINKFFLK